jgi:hypothetical protein
VFFIGSDLVANINCGRTIAISDAGEKKIIKILEEEYEEYKKITSIK